MAKERRHTWTAHEDAALIEAVDAARNGPHTNIDWNAVVREPRLRGVVALTAKKTRSRFVTLRGRGLVKPANYAAHLQAELVELRGRGLVKPANYAAHLQAELVEKRAKPKLTKRRVAAQVAQARRDIAVSDAALRATEARAASVNFCPACGHNLRSIHEAMTALALLPNGKDR